MDFPLQLLRYGVGEAYGAPLEHAHWSARIHPPREKVQEDPVHQLWTGSENRGFRDVTGSANGRGIFPG